MAYISDKNLFNAVSFASAMIKKGTSPALASHKAAAYYEVSTSDVASELGKRGSSKSRGKK